MSSWLFFGPSPGLSRLVRVLPPGLVTAPATHFEIDPCRGSAPRLPALARAPPPRSPSLLAPPPTAGRTVSPPLATPPGSSPLQPRLPGLVLVQCPGLCSSSRPRAGGSLGPNRVPAEEKPKLRPVPACCRRLTALAPWGAPRASPRVPLARSGNACRRDHGDLG